MDDEHVFVDSAGVRITGKPDRVAAWEAFFDRFPDYRNVFEQIASRAGRVAIRGRSTCSDARLAGPALWSATVEGGRIREWHVYEDTLANRRRLGLAEGAGEGA